jgi:lysophospholipase L1-like esterase
VLQRLLTLTQLPALQRRSARLPLSGAPPAACIATVPATHPFEPARFVLVAAAALAFGAIAGWLGHRSLEHGHSPVRPDAFQQIRAKTIESQLAQVEGDYVVLLGDSHAERLFTPHLCGLPVVNAGISGATADDVVALTRRLAPQRKARALLLSVGTNDIWIRRQHDAAAAERNFRARIAELRTILRGWTDRLALIAIPPVAAREEADFPRSAAGRYSETLRRSCADGSCSYVAPFAAATRDERASFAADGVHLRDYAGFVRAQEGWLCAGLGLGPTGAALQGSARP